MPYYYFPELCLELRFSKSVSCLLDTALACKTFWPKPGQGLAEPALKHSILGRWSWARTMGLLFSPRFGRARSAINPNILWIQSLKNFQSKTKQIYFKSIITRTMTLLSMKIPPFMPGNCQRSHIFWWKQCWGTCGEQWFIILPTDPDAFAEAKLSPTASWIQ